MSKEIKSVIKNVPPQKTSHPGPDGFTGEFYEIFNKVISIFTHSPKNKTKREPF